MKLVILDRDGVINQDSEHYIKSPDEWHPIPGSIDAIARLHKAGYTIAIATNQSGIARGLYDHDTLAAMHEKCKTLVAAAGGAIDCIVYCPHNPDENCACRKPGTGLLKQIETQLNCSVKNVPFVGDSFKDIQAGVTMGCQPILVKTGNGLKTLANNPTLDVPVFDDLAQFVDRLLSSLSPQP